MEKIDMVSLQPNRVKGAEYHRNIWCVTPERGASLEDVLSAGYFSHVVAQFRPGDRLEVVPEGRAWYAELIVLGVSKLDAQFGVITVADLGRAPQPTELPPQEAPATEDYVIRWAGPKAKFRIQRRADKEVLQDGFDTEAEASRWLTDHTTAMAA